MNLMKRKQEIESRLTEIRGLADKETDMEKLSAMEKECDSLQEERSSIEKKMNIASKTEVNPIIIEKNGIDKEAFDNNRLLIHFKNGAIKEVFWKDRSRKNSWTPKMKEKARLRALEQHRKEGN